MNTKKRKKTSSKLKKVKTKILIKKMKKKTLQKKVKTKTPPIKIVEIVVEKVKKKIHNKVSTKERKEMLTLFSDAYARQVMISLGGENALEIIRNYPNGMSDDEIARKLKVKISDVRSALNRMHGEGFVIYNRKKDNETGWYSYSWALNKKNIFGWADKINREKKEMFDSEVERYYCKKCGLDSLVDFTEGMRDEFKCSCCNKPLEYLDKNKKEQLIGKMIPNQSV